MYTIPEYLSKLIGLPCCQARVNIDEQIILDFGDKVFNTEPGLEHLFRGEWIISSENSSWRLIKDNQIIIGQGDDEIGYDFDIWGIMKSLTGNSVRAIKQTSAYDVCLLLGDSYEVVFMGQSREGYLLSVLTPENEVVFKQGAKWIQKPYVIPFELSANEKAYGKHSMNCSTRWEKVVNRTNKNMCCECAYFVHVCQSHYFGEFGLCSNELSSYDSSVVKRCSGCPYFKS